MLPFAIVPQSKVLFVAHKPLFQPRSLFPFPIAALWELDDGNAVEVSES
jgi:hypothetical protein